MQLHFQLYTRIIINNKRLHSICILKLRTKPHLLPKSTTGINKIPPTMRCNYQAHQMFRFDTPQPHSALIYIHIDTFNIIVVYFFLRKRYGNEAFGMYISTPILYI